MNKKSTGIAFLLAFLLGPVGLLYATPVGGAIMILAIGGTAMFVGPLAIVVGVVGWVLSMIIALIAVSSHNSNVEKTIELLGGKKASGQLAEADAKPIQDEEWETLTKYDETARAALDTVSQFGQPAINELIKAHRAVQDKTKLPSIADKIAADFKAASEKAAANKVSCPKCGGERDDSPVCPACHAWVG